MFGRDEEIKQTLQRIAMIALLNGSKQLTEDDGCRSLEGWEECRECTLDGRVQRFWVLQEDKRKERKLVT